MLLVFMLAALLVPPHSLNAQSVDGTPLQPVEPFGLIDWGALRISATGQGFPPAQEHVTERGRRMARRAAMLDARRNLVEVFSNVRVDSQTLVRDFVVTEDVAMNRLTGVLDKTLEEEMQDLPGGGILVRLSARLSAPLLQALEERGYSPSGTQAAHADEDARPQNTPRFSSVLLDARGLGFTPSLRPVAYGPRGEAPLLLPRQTPSYFRSMDAALASEAAGEAPLVLRPKGLHPGRSGDVLLGEDAARLLNARGPAAHDAVVVVY